jgi:hypothetical protein
MSTEKFKQEIFRTQKGKMEVGGVVVAKTT